MPSGQNIANNVLNKLGILELGGTPSASDSTAIVTELNAMWNSWGIDEGLIYSIQSITKALVTATASYTIGTGATWNTPVPSRIYKAFFTLGTSRNELEIVEAGKFYSHNDLGSTTSNLGTPEEVYPDYNIDPTTGFGKVYLWPIPVFNAGAPLLELETSVTFASWVLNTNYILPAGFQDAIEQALAWRMISYFGGIVAPQVIETISALGQKAELRIRTANAKNRLLQPEIAALEPLGQPAPAAR